MTDEHKLTNIAGRALSEYIGYIPHPANTSVKVDGKYAIMKLQRAFSTELFLPVKAFDDYERRRDIFLLSQGVRLAFTGLYKEVKDWVEAYD